MVHAGGVHGVCEELLVRCLVLARNHGKMVGHLKHLSEGGSLERGMCKVFQPEVIRCELYAPYVPVRRPSALVNARLRQRITNGVPAPFPY